MLKAKFTCHPLRKIFETQAKLTGPRMRLMSDGYVRNIHVKITIPLKHLSNHWRTLEIMLINFEGNFKLKCLSKLVLPIQ